MGKRNDKRERESETKGLNTGLIAAPRPEWPTEAELAAIELRTAAKEADYRAFIDECCEIVRPYMNKPAVEWPDDALDALSFLHNADDDRTAALYADLILDTLDDPETGCPICGGSGCEGC